MTKSLHSRYYVRCPSCRHRVYKEARHCPHCGHLMRRNWKPVVAWVIAAIVADVLNAYYDLVIRRLRLDNAGITALEFGSGLPHVMWINHTAHLEQLSPAFGDGAWY